MISNPQIAGVQNEFHGGILETNVFNNFPRVFGSLSDDDNLIAFIECFSATDFFKTAFLDKEILYRKRPNDYYDFFRDVMDAYSDKTKSSFWLQKIHPNLLACLRPHFEDAAYVFIERDVVAALRSVIGRRKKAGSYTKSFLLREIFLYYRGLKQMRRYRAESNVISIRFEDLAGDKERAVRRICGFLAIDFSPEMLTDRYRKNSSFSDEEERRAALSKLEMFLISFLSFFCKLMPLFLYSFLYRVISMLRPRRNNFLPTTFSIVANEKNV